MLDTSRSNYAAYLRKLAQHAAEEAFKSRNEETADALRQLAAGYLLKATREEREAREPLREICAPE
jgi:hypothetical protein